MTKEQEIVEKLTNEEKINFNTLVRKFKKEGTENFIVTKKEYIETVLNMLKEKDKEIESIRYIKNSFDYVVQKESEKKDKIDI